jgi:hypothetical protein
MFCVRYWQVLKHLYVIYGMETIGNIFFRVHSDEGDIYITWYSPGMENGRGFSVLVMRMYTGT